MIWLRRILTIPLILIFVIIFVAVLLVTQFSSMGGNPQFYNDQLSKADTYNWIYDKLIPAVLDEMEQEHPTDLPVGIEARDEIIAAMKKTLPPDEWLRPQVEAVNNAVIPYIMGDKDNFTITIDLRERVQKGAQVFKDDLLQGQAAEDVYDDLISYIADRAIDNLDNLPYHLTLSKAEVETALKSVAPQAWLVRQLSDAIDPLRPDSLTSYMTGDADHFTINVSNVSIRERIDPAAAAILQLISKPETYSYLLDQTITPMVAANFSYTTNLSYGISLSQGEIVSATKQTLMQDTHWVQTLLSDMVNGITTYIKEGDTNSINTTIDIGDERAALLNAITTMADQKLEAIFNSLPTCSPAQFNSEVATLPPGTLPSCRPTNGTYAQFKAAIGIDLAAIVNTNIGSHIPDSWVYTDAQLRQSMGASNADFLDQAHGWATGGYTFTDIDLMNRLTSDEKQTLSDVRSRIKNGYTITEADLRDAVSDNSQDDLQGFDDVRHQIHTARTWLWALWLIPLVLLIGIGFLGGRSWRTKLIWALALLFITSLVIYIAVAVVETRVIDAHALKVIDLSEYQGVSRVVAEKGNELIYNTISAFASGVQHKVLYFMIASGVLLIGIIVSIVVQSRQLRAANRMKETPHAPINSP